ncbi:hypothetical protein [Actinokineospora globicatena]|nr:hypothetical protein [Actinokineospora globicatena]
MIWATVAEVRTYLSDTTLLAGVDDAAVGRHVDRAVRSLVPLVLRWPELDEETDRPAEEDARASVVAAVAETIRVRREADQATVALGGPGAVEVIAAGGGISAGTLTVSGGSRTGGGARIGQRAQAVPIAAVDALLAAGMVGGSVPTW